MTEAKVRKIVREEMEDYGVATKNDLEVFATKEDLKAYATKEDLKKLPQHSDLAKLPQHSDLEKYATKEDLKKLPQHSDLEKYATKEDLKKLPQHSDLEKYATKEDLKKLPQHSDIDRLYDFLTQFKIHMDNQFAKRDEDFRIWREKNARFMDSLMIRLERVDRNSRLQEQRLLKAESKIDDNQFQIRQLKLS